MKIIYPAPPIVIVTTDKNLSWLKTVHSKVGELWPRRKVYTISPKVVHSQTLIHLIDANLIIFALMRWPRLPEAWSVATLLAAQGREDDVIVLDYDRPELEAPDTLVRGYYTKKVSEVLSRLENLAANDIYR